MANEIRTRAVVAIVLSLAIAIVAASAKAADAPPPAAIEVAEGIRVVPGTYAPPRQPDGNTVLFTAPDGWVVVDSGRHPAHAAAVLAAAAGSPVHTVVNTHWHLDHVAGNPALRAAHPALRVIASPAIDDALAGFLADYAGQLRALLAEAPAPAQAAAWRAELARIEHGVALRPDRAVTEGGPVSFAGRDFELGFEADAVTGGDLWLLDREHGVLAAGDLVTLPAPFLDTACPARWQAALARLAGQPFRRLVPGHGAVMDREGLATYRRAFDGLLACAAGDAPAAACTDGWLRDAATLLPDDASRTQARGLLDYYLSQVLRGPDAGKYCPAG